MLVGLPIQRKGNMKVKLNEFNGCFAAEFTAETVEDAAALVRMAANRTSELRSCSASVHMDGTVYGYIDIGKRKNATSNIKN